MEKNVRSFLINKNLFLYYLITRMIGGKGGPTVAGTSKKAMLIFGGEEPPNIIKDETPANQW